MDFVAPVALFHGGVLVAAPHMDDGVLACGGTIAALPDKSRVHFVYATDGSRSPVPSLPWIGSVSTDLPKLRAEEARQALSVLGVPEDNIHFLNFPDSRLRAYRQELKARLQLLMTELAPSCVLAPFRFDRHPDHLTLYRAIVPVLPSESMLFEYFVYYRWQLVAGHDLRNYVRQQQLLAVNIEPWAVQKERALKRFVSQTTCYFDWQKRPILTVKRVAEVSRSPELFLRTDPAYPRFAVFARGRAWLAIVFLIEPLLKHIKDLLLTLARQIRGK